MFWRRGYALPLKTGGCGKRRRFGDAWSLITSLTARSCYALCEMIRLYAVSWGLLAVVHRVRAVLRYFVGRLNRLEDWMEDERRDGEL